MTELTTPSTKDSTMRVRVTGAAGFVGSQLSDRFSFVAYAERNVRATQRLLEAAAAFVRRQVAWHWQMRNAPCRAELRMV